MSFNLEELISKHINDTKDDPREKMSKSRGNVVTVDEVVHGVRFLDNSCEFRDESCNVINDYHKLEVYRNPEDGFFYTSSRLGHFRIFLHQTGNPVPATFPKNSMNDCETTQHNI